MKVHMCYDIEKRKGDDSVSELKQLRAEKKLTQRQACELLGVSLRSYKDYENCQNKIGTLKYRYMVEQLQKYTAVDEEHGILTLDDIKTVCRKVLDEYQVKYCILFGSYAKGTALGTSDVDLLISTNVTGLRFFGIAERLRSELHKKVDLLNLGQLTGNTQLLDEILMYGVRVYEQYEKQ